MSLGREAKDLRRLVDEIYNSVKSEPIERRSLQTDLRLRYPEFSAALIAAAILSMLKTKILIMDGADVLYIAEPR